jgi:hypothetical protein
MPAAQRECLDILRAAARKAVGEDTYLPGWISDEVESVEWDLESLSSDRLDALYERRYQWKVTPAEREMEEEIDATIDALRERGGFDGLGLTELAQFWDHVRARIRSKYEGRILQEVEEASKEDQPWEDPRPKSNPTLITEKDALNSTLDVLHRRGVLDEIMLEDFLRAPDEEDYGLDPGRWTHQSFGCERRRRESLRCREQHHAIHQSSEQRPFASSAPLRTNLSPRLPGNLASQTILSGAGSSKRR